MSKGKEHLSAEQLEASYSYFKSVKIAHSRTFGDPQQISFAGANDQPSMWNLIIGDNGTGKTTVLRSLVLSMLLNNKYVRNYWVRRDVLPRVFTRNENEKATFEYVISNLEHNNLNLSIWATAYETSIDYPLPIDFELFKPTQLPKIVAYGATRKTGEAGITSEQASPIQTLFDENTSLSNAEEWLVQADYNDRRRQEENFDRVKKILLQLFKGEITDIEIRDELSNSDTVKVYFKTSYGWVRMNDLSLGYKTLIAWMVDFARQLTRFYPESSDPLKEEAVCLVDEIDLHLHPKFQRNLVAFLSSTFPKTQFIVTAHSPLIVQSFADANIIMLRKKGDQIVVDQNPTNIRAYRVDQILTSDLFGLESSRSKKDEELMETRRKILSKSQLSKKDEEKVRKIEEELNNLPVGETKHQIAAQNAVEKLAEYLKQKEANDQDS